MQGAFLLYHTILNHACTVVCRDQLKVLQKLCTDRAVAQSHCYQRSMCGNSGEGSSSLDTESYIAVADMLSAGHSMQDLYIQVRCAAAKFVTLVLGGCAISYCVCTIYRPCCIACYLMSCFSYRCFDYA